jgi:hypothetical protein
MPTFSKYPVDDADLRELHGLGLSNRLIADKINVPHWRVGRRIREIGLVPNGRIRGVRIVDGDSQQCSSCGEWRPITSYPIGRSGPDSYRLTFCFPCKSTRANRRRNSGPRAYLTDRCSAARTRARNLGTDFNLTADHLVSTYDRQDGKCFYTDVPLVIAVGNGQRDRDAISIDRVDNGVGYLKGNVVLVSTRTNTMKSDATLDEMAIWMPEWHRRAVEFLALTQEELCVGS